MTEELSIDLLKGLAKRDRRIKYMLERATITKYEDFVRVLYSELDMIIEDLEDNPELMLSDSEDRITIDIVGRLKTLSYDAAHERKIGGHVDISVRDNSQGFLWLGEAKIFKGSYAYLYKGFLQLATRYSSGLHKKDCGALLIYIRHESAADIVANWKNALKTRIAKIPELTFRDCPDRPDFAWYSTHKHHRSGRPYTMRHIGLVLGFDPKDR